MTSKNKEPQISVKGIKDRGWTDALIKRFLGEPDQLAPNPRFRSAAPMRLYLLSRVEEVEKSDEFVAARAKAEKRSQTSKNVAARKEAELLEAVRSMKVNIEILPEDQLLRRAISHYNEWNPKSERASLDSDASFLARITVNYIRHQLTSYDEDLEKVVGKIGVASAISEIRERVYDAIADAYPYYADECYRQLDARLWSDY